MDEPDERVRDRPAVDFIAEGDGFEYAIEHTRIESFPGQMKDSHRLRQVLEPLVDEIAERLPTGQFTLAVSPGAIAAVKRQDEDRARDELSEWVMRGARTLAIGDPHTAPDHFRKGSPPDTPFDVSLYRWPERPNRPRLFVLHDTPEALADLRQVRIRKALVDKCPKLAVERAAGRQTVLVLEDSDLSLSNVVDVTSAVREAAKQVLFAMPDDIYWVDAWAPPYLAELIDLG